MRVVIAGGGSVGRFIAEQLHGAMDAGRELSTAERTELDRVEQELADAAAARLRDATRRARRRA